MNSKPSSDDSMHDQFMQDAKKITETVDKMIKAGAATTDIEGAVAKILSKHLVDQLKIVSIRHGLIDYD